MAKINILPPHIYNRISAGEVVDRPYSVVKELVENAIDAGATEISIYIECGGKQLIRVVDNGCGIEREDLPSAYLPHATSKISTADDLEGVMTLGFRGEAIASISAVSQMTITSKTATGKCYKLSCDGGTLGQVIEATGIGEHGTDVCVENLFYHTPVRLGYLRTDKGEETEITTFVSRFILNRADIAFTYYVDEKRVLQSYGEGQEDAMLCVYGNEIFNNCFQIDAQKHGIHVYGYIGNTNFSKPNKSYQCVFLNGRHIVNTTISSAISGAYMSYLMKRQYPFYVLHIDMPPESFDVNVHPNKADVRLMDNKLVYGCIYSIISGILDGKAQALEYIVQMPKTAQEQAYTAPIAEEAASVKLPEFEPSLTYEQARKIFEADSPKLAPKKQVMELPFEEVEEEIQEKKKGFIPIDQIGPYIPNPSTTPPKAKIGKTSGAEILQKKFPDLYFESPIIKFRDPESEKEKKEETIDSFEANKKYLAELDEKSKQNRIEVTDCTYAGKLFNTYLLYEQGDCVYIIDQHAAHERLIFNRLKEQMEKRVVVRQPMLLPYSLKLNAFESAFIRENLSVVRDMGFVIDEPTENEFAVSEIPLDLQNINLNAFFNEILGDISGYRAIKLENILKDKLASTACKAAVKGGMNLTKEEVSALFALMDGDMGLKCPHGRPVVVKLTKTELEKMFKRIV